MHAQVDTYSTLPSHACATRCWLIWDKNHLDHSTLIHSYQYLPMHIHWHTWMIMDVTFSTRTEEADTRQWLLIMLAVRCGKFVDLPTSSGPGRKLAISVSWSKVHPGRWFWRERPWGIERNINCLTSIGQQVEIIVLSSANAIPSSLLLLKISRFLTTMLLKNIAGFIRYESMAWSQGSEDYCLLRYRKMDSLGLYILFWFVLHPFLSDSRA